MIFHSKIFNRTVHRSPFIFPVLLALFTCTSAASQEYKYEIGGMAGTSMYMGDANPSNFFTGLNPGAGFVFRSNTNFRWALKTHLMWGKISGDTKNTENVFFDHAGYLFSRNFFDMGGQAEFNFLPYSDKYVYLNTSRIAPYLLSGLGFTMSTGQRISFGLHLSLGLGVKYKILNRFNVSVEYAVRKLFEDTFDSPDSEGFNLDNPYKINSGTFKNNDGYNTLMLSVTWDFGPNDRKCMD
jgi:hypothetical protein